MYGNNQNPFYQGSGPNYPGIYHQQYQDPYLQQYPVNYHPQNYEPAHHETYGHHNQHIIDPSRIKRFVC